MTVASFRHIRPALPALALALTGSRVALAQRAAGEAPAPQPGVAAGASRTVLVLDSLDLTGIGTLSELLQARAPGLLVSSQSGSAGAAARVTARGARSVLLFGDPLLIVDGVRAVGSQRGFAVDSAVTTSRLDDVVLEHVERVEVLRGAAAAGAYGPGAANGAIVVTTRRGTPGAARLRTYAQTSAARDVAEYPRTYVGIGRDAQGAPQQGCTLALASGGGCGPDRIEARAPFAAMPARSAPGGAAGLTLGGGSAHARYWIGADARSAQGVMAGNAASRLGARANLALDAGDALAATLHVGAVRATTALRPGDQWSLLDTSATSPLRVVVEPFTPARQVSDRVDAAARVSGRMGRDATVWVWGGLSDVHRREQWRHARFSVDAFGAPIRVAELLDRGTGHEWSASAEAGASVGHRLGRLVSATEVAVNRLGVRQSSRLTHGSVSPTGSGESVFRWTTAVTSMDVWSARVGHRTAVGDRLTVDGSLRWYAAPSRMARGGRDVDGAASATWALHRSDAGRETRLRAAFGTGSTEPGVSLTGFSPAERTTEAEGGVDVPLGARSALRLTAFRQRSRGVALGFPLLPPSVGVYGFGPMAFGAVRNAGAEAELDVALLERRSAALTARLHGSYVRGRLEQVPLSVFNVVPAADGQPQLTLPMTSGAALGAFADAGVQVRDANGDGVVTANEVTVLPVHQRPALGSMLPSRTGALELRLRLGARTTVAALGDYRGGHVAIGRRPALLLSGDRASVDPSASLAEQAATVDWEALRAALVQRADFGRLRELSVSRALGGRGTRGGPVVTVAGRNLLTLTGFDGPDPETTAHPHAPLAAGGYWIQPLPATLAVRLTAPF